MGHYEHNSNWTRVFNQIESALCHSSENKMNGRWKKTHVSRFRGSVLYHLYETMTIKKCINLGWAQHFSY